MSDESKYQDAFDEGAKQFTDSQTLFGKMWSDLSQNMMRAGMTHGPSTGSPDGAKQMRSAMLRAWSEYCDELMRSPEFLQTMKESMKTAVEFRKEMNQTLGRMRHELQGSSRQDVDQIMSFLTRLERRLEDDEERSIARTEQIVKRLETLETKLARRGASTAAGKKKAPTRTAAAKKKAPVRATPARKKTPARSKAAGKKSPVRSKRKP